MENKNPKPHILIVEDEPDLQYLFKTFLETRLHCQTFSVSCGASAIDVWKNGNYDLIIMDIKLPSMNGIDVTKIIRSLEIETCRKRTPIIAYTANMTMKCKKDCINAGMDGFIAKPTEFKDIADLIKKHLSVHFQNNIPF
jgi:CheY-like chemotaxis protein